MSSLSFHHGTGSRLYEIRTPGGIALMTSTADDFVSQVRTGENPTIALEHALSRTRLTADRSSMFRASPITSMR